jgi:ABC-type transport system involved in multi-copper enzyme maturation permease subunit
MTALPFTTVAGREWSRAWKGSSGYRLRSWYAALATVAVTGFSLLTALRFGATPDLTGQVARSFFHHFSLAQFILVTLYAAAVFAQSLVREKRDDTLDLLVLSPGHRAQILLGKAMGSFLAILALLAAGVPVICYLLVFGGVTPGEVLSTHIILCGHVALVGAVAMFFSLLHASAYAVTIRTWFVLILFLAAPTVGSNQAASARPLWSFLFAINPYHVLRQELASVWPDPGAALSLFLVGFLLLGLVCGVGGLLLDGSCARGKEPQARRIRAAYRHVRDSIGRLPILRWRLPGPTIGRPGSLLERACSIRGDLRFRGVWVMFVAIYLTLIVLTIPLHESLSSVLHPVILLAGGGTMLILMFLRTALATFSARRDGTCEILLSANVEPGEIVKAHLAGQSLRGACLLAIPAGHGAFIVASRPDWMLHGSLVGALLFLAGLLLGASTGMTLTVWHAFRARNLASALAGTLGLAIPASVAFGATVALDVRLLLLVGPLVIAFVLGVYTLTVRDFRRKVGSGKLF